MCGQADRKIVQWDLNTRDVKQEYEQHLSARPPPGCSSLGEARALLKEC